MAGGIEAQKEGARDVVRNVHCISCWDLGASEHSRSCSGALEPLLWPASSIGPTPPPSRARMPCQSSHSEKQSTRTLPDGWPGRRPSHSLSLRFFSYSPKRLGPMVLTLLVSNHTPCYSYIPGHTFGTLKSLTKSQVQSEASLNKWIARLIKWKRWADNKS